MAQQHHEAALLHLQLGGNDATLLIYEHMENDILDRWFHHLDREGAPLLDWPMRLAIAINTAKGLNYMHHDCMHAIVHRDVKSSNILMDPNFQAKITDISIAWILVKSDKPKSCQKSTGRLVHGIK
jgi:kinase